MTLGGYATGLLVESHEGRPTKIEGNPDHPMSLGAANVFHQASILELYDPTARARCCARGRRAVGRSFWRTSCPRWPSSAPRGGAGLRILTETVTSPTLAGADRRAAQKIPAGEVAPVRAVEPGQRQLPTTGNPAASRWKPHYDFEQGQGDRCAGQRFPFQHPASLAYARQFARAAAPSPTRTIRRRRHEPALRRRADPDDHRLDGGPPACRVGAADMARLAALAVGNGRRRSRRRRRATRKRHAGGWKPCCQRFAGEPRGQLVVVARRREPQPPCSSTSC